jgi:regulator of cell morphogenesis and NO signaling
MDFERNTTIGEIAGAWPRAIPLFQRYGIDFCCGGRRPLDEVCREKGIELDALVREIRSTSGGPEAAGTDWGNEPPGALVDHILERYHRVLDEELPRLEGLAEKVAGVHGAGHPELLSVRDTFRILKDELVSHREKEERVLFPYIRDLDAVSQGMRPAYSVSIGLAGGAIGVMEREHQTAGLALKALRRLTGEFRPPEDACGSYRALYAGLELFEADLHNHIHLENNVLFPQALAMERSL